TITEFRHPSAASQSCAQCHQAPPSHYMEHFHMVSMRVAGQEHADVRQCFLCHPTTSWNDIKSVRWYKHHLDRHEYSRRSRARAMDGLYDVLGNFVATHSRLWLICRCASGGFQERNDKTPAK